MSFGPDTDTLPVLTEADFPPIFPTFTVDQLNAIQPRILDAARRALTSWSTTPPLYFRRESYVYYIHIYIFLIIIYYLFKFFKNNLFHLYLLSILEVIKDSTIMYTVEL